MRGNELIYKALYPSPQPSPSKHALACLPAKVIASASGCDGRASLAAITAKIVHDMPVVDFIEDLNRTLLGRSPAMTTSAVHKSRSKASIQ